MVGSALYAAISGLKSQQIKLDVIANNVANLNTFGFKASRTAFADLLSQTLRAGSTPQAGRGGTNPMQVGVGVQLAAIDTVVTQGSIQTTGNLTDLAINGEGYFIVSDGTSTAYTRAGNFSLDADGALITPSGYRVQGYTDLTNDGSTIDTSTTLSDIIVNFGEKIPGRATTTINYVCNLNADSFTFGSAELQAPGSTGLLIAAGIAVPIASYTGTQVDNGTVTGPLGGLDAGAGDFVVNGQSITFTFPVGWTWGSSSSNAQYIADQINSQSTTVYARVGSGGNLILQNLFGGEGNDIIVSGDATFLGNIGVAAGTYEAPQASSSLAGTHTITIVEATKATDTSTVPVAAGALAVDTIQIMGTSGAVTISYGPTSASNTSAQNAQAIADAINAENATNPSFFISATANANGTITLTSDLAGKSNEIIIVDPGTNPTGLDSIGTFDGTNYVVDNGTDATASNTFVSTDTTVTWTRTFHDATGFGVASSIANLEPLILGDNPPLPLIPGVTLTADQIAPGQATVVTYDAFEHQTSINVYDSKGAPHQLSILFKHTGATEWTWTATLPDEPQYTLSNDTGVLNFSPSGLILSSNPTVPISFTPAGAEVLRIFPTFDGAGSPIDGVTQFASPSTTAAESQDGFSMGTLQAFAFDPSGTLQGVYSNGLTKPLARLAIAVFSNPAGLQRTGNNNWVATGNSGLSRNSAPREGGAGEILGGSLEQSNVDAATEFTELIIAQRSFQANSRIITAQDSILQEVVNLVR
jgi:flagellar hook protein FlgE